MYETCVNNHCHVTAGESFTSVSRNFMCHRVGLCSFDDVPVYDDGIRRRLVAISATLLVATPTVNSQHLYFTSEFHSSFSFSFSFSFANM